MRKSVLGNDPFQRGAAPLPSPIAPARQPGPAKRAKTPARQRKAEPPLEPAAVAETTASPRGLQSSSVVESVFNFLFEQYWRVRVEGAEQVPRGPAMVIANHVGALPVDGPIVTMALRRARPDLLEPRWLAEDQLLNFPVLGGSLFELGAVPASFQNGLRLLKEGRPVLVFPEGTQGLSKPIFDRYQLKRFGRGGFLKLAHQAGAPIVPVGVIGGEEAMPTLAKLPGLLGLPYIPLALPPLPTRWTIRFGAPLQLDLNGNELGGEALQAQIDLARQSVEGLVKSLRAAHQSLFW
jgi:1-acyl-sn-glycerol-3-phosphate acyltransferase